MANKQALRDLQLRLANRLQVAREQPRSTGWLAVEAGNARFLLPLAQAGEIHTHLRPVGIPHAQPWVVGVANLRGELTVIVDLARLLRLRGWEGAQADGPAVALNAAMHVNAALRVDRLIGLRDATQMTADELPAERPTFVTAAWRDVNGQSWQTLDLIALAAEPLFLDVATRVGAPTGLSASA